MGVRDLRLRAAGALHRRLRRRGQRAPAGRCTSGWAAARSRASASRVRSSGAAIYVGDGKLQADIGRAEVVELPQEETERRWHDTTPQWPIMHARHLRRLARPVHGQAQGQPHSGGLWTRCCRRQPRSGGQGRHVPRDGDRSQRLRLRARPAGADRMTPARTGSAEGPVHRRRRREPGVHLHPGQLLVPPLGSSATA